MDHTGDNDLIRRALAGDQKAYEALYRTYRPRLFSLTLRRASDWDEAEDLLQMTFVRAFQSLRGYRGEAAFSTWLTRIALNVCASHVREQRRRKDCEAGGDYLPCAGPAASHNADLEEVVRARWRRDLLRRGIRSLPPRHQEAVWLRYVQDRSYAEITRSLRAPIGTVKTWLCRSRRHLRGELRKAGVLAA